MQHDQIFKLLDDFKIETPSWGYADTGTRFGKFLQPAAASTIDEKLADAGIVHKLTGCCPTVAVHVLWDFTVGVDASQTADLAKKHGISIGSINPNLFQDQIYKFGSAANADERARQHANRHVQDSIRIAKAVGSNQLSFWLADGTNYPGQDDLLARKHRLHGAFRQWHDAMPPGMTMLLEYKPFEPAFYHTDLADWGMAYVFAREAGPNAKVLVDTGHHLPGQNVEHLVAFLLDENMLGGFHFNDRKYGDDDLTAASIDPYALFRIFHQIRHAHEIHNADVSKISYVIDQSHNLKPKIEAMIQTVMAVQELFLKAAIVDHKRLAHAQSNQDVIDAETCLKDAFSTDVRPLLAQWRKARHLPKDPLMTFRAMDYENKVAREREIARANKSSSSNSYA